MPFQGSGGVLIPVCALGLAAVAVTATRSSAQTLSGYLLDARSDRPVAAATITLIEHGQPSLSTESDSTGLFRFALQQPGWYGLLVERLGYTWARTDTFAVGPGEAVSIAIRLGVEPIPLAPVVVIDRRTAGQLSTEFQRRQEAGSRSGYGRFITREALESANASSVTGVLAQIPHVGMKYDPSGNAWPVMLSQGRCIPTLYLNGARLQLARGETIDVIINLDDLEAVELYRSRTELPVQFAGNNACGAIVFWTRAGEPSGGGFWRILAASGALIGMAVLLLTN